VTFARALAVVARRPRRGAVKTRLAGAVGHDDALRVYRELLTGTLHSAEQLTGIELVLALADDQVSPVVAGAGTAAARLSPPPAAEILADLGLDGDGQSARWHSLGQRGSGLGERLANVFADLFADDFQAVAIVSSDSPALPSAYLAQAFDLLAEPDPFGRIVLGPTTDGGFYLIGTDAATWRARSAAIGDALTGAPMGSAAALAHAARATAASGLTVRQLPLWTDVDDAADLPLMDRLLSPTSPTPPASPASAASAASSASSASAGAATDRPRGEPLDGLREIYMHITNRCGLPCPHCYNRDNPRQSGEMTTAEWRRAIEQCVALGATSFVILGGDPLLRDDLLEIVDFITGVHERKVRIFFNRLITQESAAEMARVGRGLYRPLVSLDGPEKVNDALRAPGNFRDVLRSIANLVAAGLDPVVNTVLLAPVLPGLSDMARTLRAEGVTRLHLILPHQRGGLSDRRDLVPSGAEMAAAVRELSDTAAEIGLQVDNTAALRRRLGAPQDFCTCGCADLAIDPFGKVHACTITCGDPAFVAGDLRAQNLEAIWRSSPALRLLRNAHARDRAECAACPVVDACGGECWMQAHYAARLREQPAGFAAPFPYCDFVRPVFEELMAEAGVDGERGFAGSSGGDREPGGGCESPAGIGEARAGVGEADYALFDCI
jgi:radical SAM protein with 4Fe4S-binding SPASM domain